MEEGAVDMLDTPTAGIKDPEHGEVPQQEPGLEHGINLVVVHMDLMDMVSYLHSEIAAINYSN